MGNKITPTFPSYESACQSLNKIEISHLRKNFHTISRGSETITLQHFTQISTSCPQYLKKHMLPRLFHTMDTKKDNALDFEEFVSAVALFRIGNTDEKIKVLFMMYEPTKTSTLLRENLRQLLIDASIAVQREDISTKILEEWLEGQKELSTGMVEMALAQFGSQEGRLDLSEFIAFVKVEGSVQGLLQLIPSIIDS